MSRQNARAVLERLKEKELELEAREEAVKKKEVMLKVMEERGPRLATDVQWVYNNTKEIPAEVQKVAGNGTWFAVSKPGFLTKQSGTCFVGMWKTLHRASITLVAVHETPKSLILAINEKGLKETAIAYLKGLLDVEQVPFTKPTQVSVKPWRGWSWKVRDIENSKWSVVVEGANGSTMHLIIRILAVTEGWYSGFITYKQNTVSFRSVKDAEREVIELIPLFSTESFPFKSIFVRATSGGAYLEGFVAEPMQGILHGVKLPTSVNSYNDRSSTFDEAFGGEDVKAEPHTEGTCRRCKYKLSMKYCGITGEPHDKQADESRIHAVSYSDTEFIRTGGFLFVSKDGSAVLTREKTDEGEVIPCGRWYYKNQRVIEDSCAGVLGPYRGGGKGWIIGGKGPGGRRCPACCIRAVKDDVCGACGYRVSQGDCEGLFSSWSVKIPGLGLGFVIVTNLTSDGNELTCIIRHKNSQITCPSAQITDHPWGSLIHLRIRASHMYLYTQPPRAHDFHSLRGFLITPTGTTHDVIFSYIPRQPPPVPSRSVSSSTASSHSTSEEPQPAQPQKSPAGPSFAEKVHPLLTQLQKLTKIRANRPNSGKYNHEYVAQISHALEVIQVQKPEEDTAINVVQGLCKAIEEKGTGVSDVGDDLEIYAVTGDLDDERWERLGPPKDRDKAIKEMLVKTHEELFASGDEIVELMLASDELEDQHQLVFEILSAADSALPPPDRPAPKEISWPPISASSTDPDVALSFLPPFSDQDLD